MAFLNTICGVYAYKTTGESQYSADVMQRTAEHA